MMRAALSARLTRVPAQAPLGPWVLAGTALSLSFLIGWAVAHQGALAWTGAQALIILAILAIYLSVPPHQLFVGWLLFAPLFQDYARRSELGWILSSVVYVLPVAVLVVQMLMSNVLVRRLRWYDVFPFAYVILVLLSQAVVDASALASSHFYVSLVYGGILVGVPLYYFCAFGPLESLSPSRLAAVLLSSTSIVGTMAIAEHYTRWDLWGQHFGGEPRRVVSTLAQPAVLGAFLGVGIVVATAILVWDGPRSLRRLSLLTLLATVPALFFTYTRGPILATFLVALLLIGARPRRRVVAASIAAVVVVLVAANWGQISSSTLYKTRGPGETFDIRTRVVLSEASLHLASQRPIFGWGYDTFNDVKNAELFDTGTLPQRQLYEYTSHNTYLTILVELGLAGLALVLLPWTIIVSRTLRALRGPKSPQWYSLALLGILGVIALTGLTTDYRFFSFVPALAWISAGLLRRRMWTESSLD